MHPTHTYPETIFETGNIRLTPVSESSFESRRNQLVDKTGVVQNQLEQASRQKWRVSIFNIIKAVTCLRLLLEAIFDTSPLRNAQKGVQTPRRHEASYLEKTVDTKRG